jgi:GDP-L-fucose synthase
VGVYAPAEVLREDDVWRTLPSENDRFAGWAKRMGELQAEAYRLEYGWDRIAVVRPANVYGAFDNFDLENATAVAALIKRAVDGEDPLVVWGDGSAERDFVHARDVARGTLLVAENMPPHPVNLGSGVPVSIRRLVETIVGNLDRRPEVRWDTAKPSGDRRRVLDITRARALGFEPAVTLEAGVRETLAWYRDNRKSLPRRYDVFDR